MHFLDHPTDEGVSQQRGPPPDGVRAAMTIARRARSRRY